MSVLKFKPSGQGGLIPFGRPDVEATVPVALENLCNFWELERHVDVEGEQDGR
ncbi:hypothetical protein MCOR27_001289 [Pyricularia oryzae]|uniref:Uncharacterized protein n=1 Tax=Pyricularia grisea TaxID=148305 RepID=A0ABQ8NTA8_PYRGI|nr:hypothetical protein MCOR01_007128 [Pyricularia oryzae]KAI6301865.1 hypothetical protein MCOR33_002704 [Pyricularia grisea]KAI6260335.1 hypothetical protein MCOR19_003351 [Pyricularia oryzae]KAI6280795.1 hypothetical protein MCOR26_003558 [Pyricularia oryzae]KAI6287723.1 hypothetical protein MCOR27_001289 [Pyricularia oryzae]